MSKTLYTQTQYNKDFNYIYNITHNVDHVVGIFRGSLLLAKQLSNVRDIPMSILKFQSYDGEDKVPTLMHDAGLKGSKCVLVIDDIYDSGRTAKEAYKYIQQHVDQHTTIRTLCLFGKQSDSLSGYEFIHQHDGEWVDFWWELNTGDPRFYKDK